MPMYIQPHDSASTDIPHRISVVPIHAANRLYVVSFIWFSLVMGAEAPVDYIIANANAPPIINP